MNQLLIPIFKEMDAAADAKRIERHIELMRICWPDWQGPIVSDDIHGRCEVGTCIVFSETDGGPRYHYCAPCKIIEISPDGTTIRASVDYPDFSLLSQIYNNKVLRLHITEVWPPVAELNSNRQ